MHTRSQDSAYLAGQHTRQQRGSSNNPKHIPGQRVSLPLWQWNLYTSDAGKEWECWYLPNSLMIDGVNNENAKRGPSLRKRDQQISTNRVLCGLQTHVYRHYYGNQWDREILTDINALAIHVFQSFKLFHTYFIWKFSPAALNLLSSCRRRIMKTSIHVELNVVVSCETEASRKRHTLFFRQKSSRIWEILYKKVGNPSSYDGDKTFQDENPRPS